ncbi:MAG: hypothetical protein GWP08_09100 [Nitrospiraceae bacterium]|nr:hypothetical protein [Nitrospiraceae bacterium]
MDENTDTEDVVDHMVKNVLGKELPPDVQENLHQHLAAFRRRLGRRDLAAPRRTFTLRFAFRVMLAVVCAAVLFIEMGRLFGPAMSPTWAEVVQTFDSVPFFKATIYSRANALATPLQQELWMEAGGRLRLRAGNEVTFGEKGQMTQTIAFADAAGTAGQHHGIRSVLQQFAAALGTTETFSFESFLRALPGEERIWAALPNPNVSISHDIVVFDMTTDHNPDWIRVWALRESRLPIRVLFWSPESGGATDVLLSYSDQQPPEFFDADAFRASLVELEGDPASQAYALIQDPGGRPVTPRDVANQAAAADIETPDQT